MSTLAAISCCFIIAFAGTAVATTEGCHEGGACAAATEEIGEASIMIQRQVATERVNEAKLSRQGITKQMIEVLSAKHANAPQQDITQMVTNIVRGSDLGREDPSTAAFKDILMDVVDAYAEFAKTLCGAPPAPPEEIIAPTTTTTTTTEDAFDFEFCELEMEGYVDHTPFSDLDDWSAKVGDKIEIGGGASCPHAPTIGYVYCQHSSKDWVGIIMKDTTTGHGYSSGCAYGITSHHCDHESYFWYFNKAEREKCGVKNLSEESGVIEEEPAATTTTTTTSADAWDFEHCAREATDAADGTALSGLSGGFVAHVGDKIEIGGGSSCPHAPTVGFVYCQHSSMDWIAIVMDDTSTGHSGTSGCAYGVTTGHCDHANSMWYFNDAERKKCGVKNLDTGTSFLAVDSSFNPNVAEKVDTSSFNPNFEEKADASSVKPIFDH